jgi:hypothetical protein
MDSPIGATNMKVSSISNFHVGQTILVGSGSSQESATISLVGTAGGTLTIADTLPGNTVVPVSSAEGFSSGQTITIGRGKEAETATILSITGRVRKTLIIAALRFYSIGSRTNGAAPATLGGLMWTWRGSTTANIAGPEEKLKESKQTIWLKDLTDLGLYFQILVLTCPRFLNHC